MFYQKACSDQFEKFLRADKKIILAVDFSRPRSDG